MRVRTELIQQYAIVIMVSESMMANGMSRLGFLASSPEHGHNNTIEFKQVLLNGYSRGGELLRLLCFSPVVATVSKPINP